ncbi:OmpA family protein [Gammaproteobacteria bacterium]|jgi:chemotaxis protein MotB|nr:OmpA family protein [Gammaproteobacteria bacterium]
MAEEATVEAEVEQDASEKEVFEEGAELEAAIAAAEQAAAGSSDDDDEGEDCPECKGGAPAWMATFADMATLLMAFFVLLLSFSDTELPKFEKINGSIQDAFGIKKIIPKITIPAARSMVAEVFTPADAERTLIDNPRQRALDPDKEFLIQKTKTDSQDYLQELEAVKAALSEQIEKGEVEVSADGEKIVVSMIRSQEGGDAFGVGEEVDGVATQALIDVAAIVTEVQSLVTTEIGIAITSNPTAAANTGGGDSTLVSTTNGDSAERIKEVRADLKAEIEQGLLEVEEEGDMIVIRIASQGSFESGSARLEAGFLSTLAQISNTIEEGSSKVRVEGHTDNVPIGFSETFNSNWDLSAARAASVASYLGNESRLSENQLEVVGFADTVPIEDNSTPAGRTRNRRIEIKIPNS